MAAKPEPAMNVKAAPAAPVEAAPPAPLAFTAHAIHLVRTTMQVNLALSQMADQKASILMGATFVVFTISVGLVTRGGDVPIALLVLAMSSFLSALCAVATILPSIRPPKVVPGSENLLFFGVFTQLTEQEFADRVIDQLQGDESVFRTMLRDIYQNGQVLQRKKYKFLGYAYRIFLAGLTLTLITFLIEKREALMRIL